MNKPVSKEKLPRVLILTSLWPTAEQPNRSLFLVQQTNRIQQLGFPIQIFQFNTHKNPLNYLRGWLRLRDYLKKHQVDIIHAHFGQSALITLFIRKPLVITYHGSDLMGIPNRKGSYSMIGKILVFLSQLISRRAHLSICVSQKLANKLPSNVPYEIIPCGIELEKFPIIDQNEARKKLGLPLEKKIIFFPANPNRIVKNFQLAKEAVNSCDRQDLLLIPAQQIPHRDMVYYYNAANLIILTSFHEGSPTIIKEALACNRPIIATDVGDVKERIQGVSQCYLVGFDVLQIRQAITSILNSKEKSNGRDVVSAISEENVAKKIGEIYTRIYNSGKSK